MQISTTMTILLTLGCVSTAGAANAQSGDGIKTKIKISRGAGGPRCVILHDNENSASKAARSGCGKIVELANGGKRRVSFRLSGKKYSFDPNRIFTASGRAATMRPRSSKAAQRLVAEYARKLFSAIGGCNIVALHNNAGGSYSLASYRKGDRNTADVHRAAGQSRANFFLTASKSKFNRFKAAGYNAVLQKRRPANDGSLSVRCAGSGYVNIEALRGQTALQKRMLRLAR